MKTVLEHMPAAIHFWMLLYVAFSVALMIQAHRLFVTFRTRFPEVARESIPHAFDWARSPEKFWYFFRKSSIAVLRSDAIVWRLRRQVVWLAITVFVLFPLVFVLFIALLLLVVSV